MKAEFTDWKRRQLLKRLSGDPKKSWIMHTLLEKLNKPPTLQAAEAMHQTGIYEKDLADCIKHPGFTLLPEEWLNNTINELRDLERPPQ